LAHQQPEDLPAEDLGKPRVVHSREAMEDPGPIHLALGHQENRGAGGR
jgi:hypothetical protein